MAASFMKPAPVLPLLVSASLQCKSFTLCLVPIVPLVACCVATKHVQVIVVAHLGAAPLVRLLPMRLMTFDPTTGTICTAICVPPTKCQLSKRAWQASRCLLR